MFQYFRMALLVLGFSFLGAYVGDDGIEYDSEDAIESTQLLGYKALPIYKSDKKIIHSIISTVGEKPLPYLLVEQPGLERKGNQIVHVHPLRFLGYALSDDYLRECMGKIHSNAIKWHHFAGGLCKALNNHADRGEIAAFLDGFAEQVNADPVIIRAFAEQRDFEGMILMLID